MAGRTVDLVGHADPRGPSDYNVTLGQSRADAVASYLEGTGRDETGWAHDRRVDFSLTK